MSAINTRDVQSKKGGFIMSMNNVNGKISEGALLGGITGGLNESGVLKGIDAEARKTGSIFSLQKNNSDNKIGVQQENINADQIALPEQVIETVDRVTVEGKSYETKHKLNIKQ